MPTIWLGNHAAVDHIPTGEIDDRGEPVRARTPIDGKRYTIAEPPDGAPMAAIIADLTAIWAHHSDAESPAWVASTDPTLTSVLAGMWDCEAREHGPIHVPWEDEV